MLRNAGYLQGRLVRRDRVPKPNTARGTYWHWKDLNVGVDVQIYGTVYHLCNCDQFTKKFLQSQGILVNEPESLPEGDHTDSSKEQSYRSTEGDKSQGIYTDRLFRFLQYDKKVLRFFATSQDEKDGDESRMYKIHYYLVDGTVEMFITGKSHTQEFESSRILNRIRLPTDARKITEPIGSTSCNLATEYYMPDHFMVGNTISILGKRYLIYDCDLFTRRYFKECLKMEQPPAISQRRNETTSSTRKMEIPPHTGIGSPEDTIRSCLSVTPREVKKDIIQYVDNIGKVLRYKARLVAQDTTDEDQTRTFVVQYSLADGKISVYQHALPNTGYKTGYFLKSAHVPKSPSGLGEKDFYSPVDFLVGSEINVFGTKFLITGADLAVYKYMQSHPQKFPQENIQNMRQYMEREGLLQTERQNEKAISPQEEG